MRYHHYHQHDETDCGPACLQMVARFYGKQFPLNYIKRVSYQKRTGVTLLALSDAAEQMGLRTIGLKLNWLQIKNIQTPCIITWNKKHFVVVFKITNKHVIVGDPAQGIIRYSHQAFKKSWYSLTDETLGKMGITLVLEPTPDFYKLKNITERKHGFSHLFKYLTPYTRHMVNIGLAILAGSLLNLIFPFLTQAVVDVGIGNNSINFIFTILLAQVAITLGQAANNLLKNWLMLHVTSRVNISLVSDFLGKLMRLPIAFFDSKRLGDILQRISDFSRIQKFLTEVLISITMAAVAFIVYCIIMAGYNNLIFSVFIVGSTLYILWVLLFLKRRRKIDYMRFQAAASNQSNIVQLINGMQEIKLNNCEKQKKWAWEKIQVKLYDIGIKGLSLAQTQHIGGMLIDQLKNVAITFLAAKFVIDGQMTLGMMLALQYIVGQMNAPIDQVVDFIQSSQDTKISLERLNEIHQIDDEETTNTEIITSIPTNADLELRDVTFQYNGPRSKKVIDNINLKIKANQMTAIVGVSGSGKTTLLKLLLAFYKPNQGQVLLNNIPIEKYSCKQWRANCGVVMQEGVIFSDTIANNIGVSDENLNMDKGKKACQLANLENFVSSKPLGYNTLIGPEGIGISSGQKQRVLIARALYKNAPYVMFDEATNSLDANNERAIMNNLDNAFKGKTVVIVAHRLSTVKNADNIIVLDAGKIVEQGKHQELVKLKGHYFNLVKNQLELGN